ncbi:zinc finger protein 883 isoform X2 [Nilaparvata lugens]|uniref:zinc finger protein 883 isoform X2 n=1 Tax=Nilaparvata lugens TaxID=108931 RepID=UPI00193E0F69|nr:zinc finger protein 883 isoform X2 [Nilaparvata lugens]
MANCWKNPEFNEDNLHEICRLCLSRGGIMSSIFSSPGGEKSLPLTDRIMSFTAIKGSFVKKELDSSDEEDETNKSAENTSASINGVHEDRIQEDCKAETMFEENDENGCDLTAGPEAAPYLNSDDQDDESSISSPDSTTDHVIDDREAEKPEESNMGWIGGDSNLINCPSCNKPFNNQQQLDRHQLIHTQDAPFPCDYCEATFNDRAALKMHWRDHAGPRTLICMTCGETFADRCGLTQHVTLHDQVKPFHCPTCNKAFTYRSDLRKHAVIHTGARPYVCKICNKSFTRSTNLNKHARAHAGNRPFACTKCEKMFSSRADLARHAVIHTGEKPYSCLICGLAFNRKDKLTRHEKLHTEDRAHACGECPTSFHRKEELTKHIQFHHFRPDPATMASAIMDDTSQDIDDIKVEGDEEEEEEDTNVKLSEGETEDMVISVDPFHVESDAGRPDAGQLLFSCGICHKRFSDKTYLRKHRLIHSEEKCHTCSTCHKSFYRRRELVRHEAVHTGFKPFPCAVCQKTFARRDKLARHQKTHYECATCHQRFAQLHKLVEHELVHNTNIQNVSVTPISSQRSFRCSLCPAAYSRNDNLSKHMRAHRSEQRKSMLKANSEALKKNPVDYLTQMNPELKITIRTAKSAKPARPVKH